METGIEVVLPFCIVITSSTLHVSIGDVWGEEAILEVIDEMWEASQTLRSAESTAIRFVLRQKQTLKKRMRLNQGSLLEPYLHARTSSIKSYFVKFRTTCH